ncbi:cytosolic carboxypeptidase-like protein 5 [Aethina tumida]|uniref:cytosolic carboxypeptidase-like protein 5 n=1 Tax=Aethina tumida TaxID=116153 RepID=UPI00096B0ADD|nr:cytosolic carboxypeptidase-like protein 5 [Aethina tumida]
MEGIKCSEFTFFNDFDSANLARVEYVTPTEAVKQTGSKSVVPDVPDAEFNIWTKPDCHGTEYENGNRTWFYFGLKANEPSILIKFNLVDLNRQGKMYSQGMAPVHRIIPGKPQWERIRDRPTYTINDNIFTLTFKFRTPENVQSIMYFAFTYPFTYTELDRMLTTIDRRFINYQPMSEDDIYYVRERICNSLDGRSIDLITLSSYHGITSEREVRLKNLFPDKSVQRPFKFIGKKVIFISARVHPGETPSSFVFNGLLNQLLCRDDLSSIILRKMYVFKLIPFLNPDGVARGHYRTDTRGVNLNRVYMNPNFTEHPSVFAARSLIRYYHFGEEREDVTQTCDKCMNDKAEEQEGVAQNDKINKKISHMTLEEGDTKPSPWCNSCKADIKKLESTMPGISDIRPTLNLTDSPGCEYCRHCGVRIDGGGDDEAEAIRVGDHGDTNESGLYLYIDLHGHASKKGIFMYGNYFEEVEKSVECMLLPKLMSLNNHNFHFNSCNFSERNMFLKDKRDGMSRAGSGRVSVLSLTGLVRSYTLECNYNTGRHVNILPPTLRESAGKIHTLPVPPKYTPLIFEEVGKSLCSSILDMTGHNPLSRLCNSEFRSLNGLREWLAMQCGKEQPTTPPKGSRTKKTGCLQTQGKPMRGVPKSRPSHVKTALKKGSAKVRSAPMPIERKENIGVSPTPSCSFVTTKSSHKLNKFNFKAKSRKELSLKTKNSPSEKKSSNPRKQKSKLDTIKEEKKDKDQVEIEEIRFFRNNGGKTVIAKYKNNDQDQDVEDNLVVTWGPSTNAHIYTHKGRISSSGRCEPSTSRQFRVHNFAKTAAFTKNKKHTLRRLGSATESLTKVEKKKKKKIKTKVQ